MSDEPEVVVHPPLREVAVGAALGLAASAFFGWLALDALPERWQAALPYAVPALGFLSLTWHVLSLRVVSCRAMIRPARRTPSHWRGPDVV